MAADLRGASADALDALTSHVDGVGGADAARTGDDLFAVAGLLRSEPALRRVATDVSTEGSAKAGLLRSVLEGKVSETALGIVTDAVQRRWTRPRDLADALEHLGVIAVVRSSDDDAGRLADELFAVRRLVDGDGELRSALGDPARSAADKGALLEQLLSGRTLDATRRLARQALAGSYRNVSLALEAFERVAASVRDQRVATVRVAQPLADGERDRLQSALSRSYGRQVHLDVVVDPEVLGGMRVEIGDDVIDGTVSARLDEARRKLAG
ncbi:F0F1 ATP synthase subunit delta [Nocardioides aequoreus]|uniref:F0F1 ATP synthase subunit delta n=1 Tax=Nocardioides aequoreus TaxID=397278 RepID=UPI00068B4868|nr:F0F1 ATP synthase subunit delta [Nocardioides aequoreus]